MQKGVPNPRHQDVLAFFAKLAPCQVGMEACGSAHYWAREIAKLGHAVKFAAAKVRQGLWQARQDGCGGDAAAICEAVTAEHVVRAGEKGSSNKVVDAA